MSNQSTNPFTNEEEDEDEFVPITRTASVRGWGSSLYPRDETGRVLVRKGGRSCRRRRRASRRRASRRRASRRRRM